MYCAELLARCCVQCSMRLRVTLIHHLGNKGIRNLCFPGLMGLHHALTALNLANCNIKPRGRLCELLTYPLYILIVVQGIHTLVCCFMKHMGLSASLQHLDLSRNVFDLDSSIAVEVWLAAIKDFGSLRYHSALQLVHLVLTTFLQGY